MQQLVLSFSEKSLTLLQKQASESSMEQIPLELAKPLVKERISSSIQTALSTSSLFRSTWFATDYTLFPGSLFDASQLQAYYELNHGALDPQKTLRYDSVESLDLMVIYALPTWLDDYCKNELQFAHLRHEITLQLANLAQQKHRDQIQVFFHENQFVLSVFKQKQLLSCTANAYQQETDFIYFLLAHQQKLQLDQSFELNLVQAGAQLDLKNIHQLLMKFKDFEKFNIQESDMTSYQNNILCGSFEEH
jgi:hypothetical protein